MEENIKKKITKIETSENGLGYILFFNDNSKLYVNKYLDDPGIHASFQRYMVRIIYKGKEYKT